MMVRFRTLCRRYRAPLVFSLAVTLLASQGCSRTEPLHRSDAPSQANPQTLPFHSDTAQGQSTTVAARGPSQDVRQASSVPFRDESQARVLPAGTLLTVQLENSLSTGRVGAGDTFTASVAAPLKVDRDTFVERGATVTGRIESSRIPTIHSGRSPGSGYFQLTLSSITRDGRQLSLQTSSLFAKGAFRPSEGVRVPKGRRLTFRLTAPVALDAPAPLANAHSTETSTQ